MITTPQASQMWGRREATPDQSAQAAQSAEASPRPYAAIARGASPELAARLPVPVDARCRIRSVSPSLIRTRSGFPTGFVL